MNVEQNIAFGLKMQKRSADEIEKKVRDAIALVDLKGKEKSYPANLSGGQQKRVALARSIVTEPKVLLLDEPLSAIDAKLRKELQTRIREIHLELGLTTVFVTHDQDEAMVMSDVIELFHAGRIEQAGSPVSVYTKPVSTFAASFIGTRSTAPPSTRRRACRSKQETLSPSVRKRSPSPPKSQRTKPAASSSAVPSQRAFPAATCCATPCSATQ